MNFEPLIANLAHHDETERSHAAEDLGYANAADAVQPLVERLPVEPSRKVRETIFLALGRIDSPTVAVPVAALLDSDDAFLRNQAIGLLQRKGAAAVPALLARMGDPDPDVRKFVIDTAAGIDSPDVEPVYDAGIRDRDGNVVIATIEHLSEQRMRRFKPTVEQIFLEAAEPMLVCAAFSALLAIGDAASWHCILHRYPTATSVPRWQRGWWIRALGEFGGADEIEVFHPLIADHTGGLPRDAIDALGRFQDRHGRVAISEDFWKVLRALVGIPMPPEDRFQLLRVAGGFGAPVSIGDHLLALLEQGDRLTKLGAIEGLVRWNQPGLLARMLARGRIEPDPEVAEAIRDCGRAPL